MNDRRRFALATIASTLILGGPAPLPATPLRTAAGPYRLEILIDGEPAATFYHERETYVLGHLGRRYTLRVVNTSGERIEAVVSVDGLDVIDGEPANARTKRGYVVPAWGSVDIDGFRISASEAAAFRFSRVSQSYAARTGVPRNVGVIGVAVYAERIPRRVPHAVAVPHDERYGRADAGRGAAGAPSASAPHESADYEVKGGESAGATDAGATAGAEVLGPTSGEARSSNDGASGPSEGARAEGMAQSKSSAAERSMKRERPGLGTEFGEAVSSPVREVSFQRANPDRPDAALGARYNDRQGLIAMGVDVDGWRSRRDAELRQSANPFPDSRPYAEPPAGWNR